MNSESNDNGAQPKLINHNAADAITNKLDQETDLLISHLANSEKLVPENKRWSYADGKLDSTMDDFLDKREDKHDRREDKYGDKYGIKYANANANKHEEEKPDNRSNYNSTKDDKQEKTDGPRLENSEDDLRLRKYNLLIKLAELKRSGVPLTQDYDMQSDYKTMEFEYDLQHSLRSKRNGIDMLSGITFLGTKMIEMANDAYNPFEFKLQGWADSINKDMDKHYDLFGELYEKYFGVNGKKYPPEIRLMFALSYSAIQFGATRKLVEKMPTLNSILQMNPDITDDLRQKAIAETAAKRLHEQKEKLDVINRKEQINAFETVNQLKNIKNEEKKVEMRKINENMLRQNLHLTDMSDVKSQTQTQPTMELPSNIMRFMSQQQERLKKVESFNKVIVSELERIRSDKSERTEREHTDKSEVRSVRSGKSSRSNKSTSSKASVITINKDIDQILQNTKNEINRQSELSRSEQEQSMEHLFVPKSKKTPKVLQDLVSVDQNEIKSSVISFGRKRKPKTRISVKSKKL